MARGVGAVTQMMKYLATGGGFMSLPSAPLLRFPAHTARARHARRADASRALFHQGPEDPQAAGFPVDDDFLLSAAAESLGSIHIRSQPEGPAGHPLQLPRRSDRPARHGRRLPHDAEIVDTRRWMPIATRSIRRAVVGSDDEILTWFRNNSQTAYHPIGTCLRVPGPNAVVDDRLKVHGIEGLRIADASTFRPCLGQHQCAQHHGGREAADLLRGVG